MKLERPRRVRLRRGVADQRVGSIEEAVSFEPAESRKWRLTLRTGKTLFLVLRGLDFRRKGNRSFPASSPPSVEAESRK